MAGRDTYRGVAGGPARHVPVLLPEVLATLAPRDGGIYVDGTFGAGGYTRAILEAAECTVLALDRDPKAREDGAALVSAYAPRLILRAGCFSELDRHVAEAGFAKVDGVALDIGVSSMQLDEAERGFSFQEDGPLDMRMDPQSGASAADVVNSLPARELAQVIRVLGEEKRAGSIARAIVRARDREAITRTGALADIVSGAVGGRRGERKHPATRTFQALRIYVNRELEELAEGLNAAERVLDAGGRLVVVAFHSLEDRMVKRFIAMTSGQGRSASRHMPLPEAGPAPSFIELHHGGIAPGDEELAANPRARSARLRAARRTEAPALGLAEREFGLPQLAPLPEPREGGWQ